jgi:hypothetical protein
MAGKVTEFAQKKFDDANMNVPQYLAQVKSDMTNQLLGEPTKQSQQSQPV